jgi:hypothetical protein
MSKDHSNCLFPQQDNVLFDNGCQTSIVNNKYCEKCKKNKPIEEFRVQNQRGWQFYRKGICRECHNKRATKYWHKKTSTVDGKKRTKIALLRTHLRREYGITLEQYNEILESQQGKCAICGKDYSTIMDGKKARLAVDHCHKTGAIRGLLCNSCNTGLGNLKDDPDLLRAAIKYIERYLAREKEQCQITAPSVGKNVKKQP